MFYIGFFSKILTDLIILIFTYVTHMTKIRYDLFINKDIALFYACYEYIFIYYNKEDVIILVLTCVTNMTERKYDLFLNKDVLWLFMYVINISIIIKCMLSSLF